MCLSEITLSYMGTNLMHFPIFTKYKEVILNFIKMIISHLTPRSGCAHHMGFDTTSPRCGSPTHITTPSLRPRPHTSWKSEL